MVFVRYIFALIVGVAISFIFLGLTIYMLASFKITVIGEEIKFLKTESPCECFSAAGFELMQKSFDVSRFVILPVVSLVTGGFTAFLATNTKRGRIICSIIAIIPITVILCYPFYSWSSILLLVVYGCIAGCGGYIVVHKDLG
jgi:hypothetical protein